MIKIVESFMSDQVVARRNKWENDVEIQHFTTPNFKEEPLPYRTLETTYIESILRLEESRLYDYLVFDDDELIGECSIMIDPSQLERKTEGSGWVGLVIGEAAARGRGLGREIMEFLEYECRNLGLSRIELGVFEFNKNAIKLYEKMGYKRFVELDNFTFYDGKWYKDIRLEKLL